MKIHTTFLGGGFGRRGEADFVTDAVETSKAVGKPVKVVWTREDDMQHDFYRPVTYVRMSGRGRRAGKPVAFMQRIVVQQSLMKRHRPACRRTASTSSRSTARRSLPYDIPNIRVEYTRDRSGHPVRLLALGRRTRINGFVVEAFIDELAARGRQGPVRVPARAARASTRATRRVLELAAEKSGWGKPLPQGRARGIAVMEAFGSIVGAGRRSVGRRDGAVRVHKRRGARSTAAG